MVGSRGVTSQVEEETHILHTTILLKVLFEEPSCLHVDLIGERRAVCVTLMS